ncbi:unnamed protein product [Orchesella dallaii]|uniref:Uncharacterized protein n=1 Tax=Orchesella dallaii TaxID=48710 RepID=A0ABP1PST1_9HEXA
MDPDIIFGTIRDIEEGDELTSPENVYEVENVHEAEEIKLQVIDELDEHHILVRIPWEHLPNGSVLDAGGCMIERG